MKSITVTTQNAINYGAVLQAYALQKILEKLGVEDRLLDLDRMKVNYYLPMGLTRDGVSAIYNNFIKFKRKAQIEQKMQKFRDFVKDEIKTTRRYPQIADVVSNPPRADVYITGGDQMFNQSCMKRATNILKFGDPGTKRISYSSSLGCKWYLNNPDKDAFFERLHQYHSLSLREPLLPKSDFPDASCNVDPTLLLNAEAWHKFIKPYAGPKYILCYSLLDNRRLDWIVKKESKRLGLPVWVISPNARSCCKAGNRTIYNAGPIDFLNLIYHAEEIISTSFHGVCFSIIFEKNFYCLIKNEGDPRYETLLGDLHLENRIVQKDVYSLDPINYQKVRQSLRHKQQDAISYLRGALEI